MVDGVRHVSRVAHPGGHVEAGDHQVPQELLRRYPYGAESVQGCLGFEPVSAHSTSWGFEACRFQRRHRISAQQSERHCVRAAEEPRRQQHMIERRQV